MKIQADPPIHLTYCLNIHAGETWEENFAAIRDNVPKVRDRLGRDGPFGLGLRLSRQAADELDNAAAIAAFGQFLQAEGLYVFTVNGFPYGRFHGTTVKQDAYAPDWRTPERREYTLTIARVLAALLPEATGGSISTVPGSYKAWIQSPESVHEIVTDLADVAAELSLLAKETGRSICLALEPEPDCYLETTDETVEFFTETLARQGCKHLRSEHGLGLSESDRILREHLGVCLDTAHAAVQFEDLAESLTKLQLAGVTVAKVQLSSALQVRPTAAAVERLGEFCDPVYLHQVKALRPDGEIDAYDDLPAALQAAGAGAVGRQWRVHFHVPLFLERAGELASTSAELSAEFWSLLLAGATEHLEIETYTFDVLPPDLRLADVTESIAREYRWVLSKIAGG